jgi:hypothetical protein
MRMRDLALLGLLVVTAGCHLHAPEHAPAAPEKVSSSAINNDYVKMGYHPITKNGQTLYCRTETVTDSHFTNRVCLTEEQLKEQTEKQQAARDQIFRGQVGINCQTAKCPN